MTLYDNYFSTEAKQLAILIDPEKHSEKGLQTLVQKINHSRVDLIFVGSSLSARPYNSIIEQIKNESEKPVLLFPGNSLQLGDKADALLNLSLISGRNPEFLIGEHVRTSMFLKKSQIEIIPTGYILIDGGKTTAVEYMSDTKSIPRNKLDIAIATALAGEFLGLKCIYLETGSGAEQSVPNEMLEAVRGQVSIPIICGGGIKTQSEIEEKWSSGANIVVVGTAFENNPELLNDWV